MARGEMSAQAAMIQDLKNLRTNLKEQGVLLSKRFKRLELEKKERDD